jgi:UTP--glucose-1-phosphate uridylyltransferase
MCDDGRYGFAAGEEVGDNVLKVHQILEKPGFGGIDSDYAVVSGYVFGPEMLPAVEEAMRRINIDNTPRELGYTDAIDVLLEQGKDVYALQIKDAKYYDCGNKLEYLKAVVEFGLKHDDLREQFSKYLKDLKV